MKLRKLHLKNIRSYGQHSIEFPEGSLLLAGDVGAGKTTLLLAIEYALFGLQPGQKGSALLRNNESLGEVILECEIDGHEIAIERHLKRENKSIVSDYTALTFNGETREYSVTELKTRVLELLGYPAEFVKKNNLLYRYTVYTPQEQMKQIVMEDAETRLNVLRHVFGIDKYKRIRENLALLINRFKEESKVLQGEVKAMEQDRVRLTLTKHKVQELGVQIEEKVSALTLLVEQRKGKELELASIEKKIKEKEQFEKEVEKTNILVAVKQESLARCISEEREIERALSESAPAFNETAHASVLGNIVRLRESLEKARAQHLTLLSALNALEQKQREQSEKRDRIFKIDMCPTCLQNVSENHKHIIMNETENQLVDVKKQKAQLEEQQSLLKKELESHIFLLNQEEQKKIEGEIAKSHSGYLERSKQKVVDLKKQREELEKDISFLVQHHTALKNEILSFSKFDTHYRLKQDELRHAFLIEKNAEILCAELKKERELAHAEIELLEETMRRKGELELQLKNLSDVGDWLSSQFLSLINFTEMQVMMKLRREFSRIFSKWFQMIAGEVFEVQLDENFTPIILQGDVEMEYAFLSGGERTAVALAYRLALNQTINSVLSQIKTRDIVILDEPTDGFSEAQIDKIRDVLEELKVAQLIIVSHEQKIESFVDSIIRLKKTGDISGTDTQIHAPALQSSADSESVYQKT